MDREGAVRAKDKAEGGEGGLIVFVDVLGFSSSRLFLDTTYAHTNAFVHDTPFVIIVRILLGSFSLSRS